jgi:hypothetical protein
MLKGKIIIIKHEALTTIVIEGKESAREMRVKNMETFHRHVHWLLVI